MIRVWMAMICLLLAGVQPAASQTQDEIVSVFAGAWRIYDGAYVNGGPCTIALSRNPAAEAYAAEQAYCGGGLEQTAAWGIDKGQLVLLNGSFQPIARLGGNANRISGGMNNGQMVILERTRPGDPEPATPDCLYLGYSQQCASGGDRLPLDTASGAAIKAKTLVALQLRDQPRPDAPVVSTVEPGVCLAFSECRVASDGPWCRTTHQGAQSWARQHAVRLGEFPVLTYQQGCTVKFVVSEE